MRIATGQEQETLPSVNRARHWASWAGKHMVALYTTFFNFVRVHKTVKCSPAMAAGLTGTLWSMEDIVGLIGARAEKPKARGAYKPRQTKAA